MNKSDLNLRCAHSRFSAHKCGANMLHYWAHFYVSNKLRRSFHLLQTHCFWFTEEWYASVTHSVYFELWCTYWCCWKLAVHVAMYFELSLALCWRVLGLNKSQCALRFSDLFSYRKVSLCTWPVYGAVLKSNNYNDYCCYYLLNKIM